MRGKEEEPVLRMKVIADQDLWIWSFHFSLPGGFNDLNVLEEKNASRMSFLGSFPA